MFSTSYLQTLIDGAQTVRPILPGITHAAEAAALRLASGGNLYIASVRPDFVSEGFIRSGGLMMLREYDPEHPPSSHDVIIVGWSNTDLESDQELLSQLKETGSLIIGIGPEAKQLRTCVDSFLLSNPPCPDLVLSQLNTEFYPLVSLENLILLWTFTGELVAALSRNGVMPVMFQSVLVPGARNRNESFGTIRFHSPHSLPPIRAGQLGDAYLDKISSCLKTLLREAPVIDQVAAACAEVLNNKKHIHAFLISHFPVYQAGAPGDPGYMTPLEIYKGETPDPDELERKLNPGDLLFFLGYYRRPTQAYEIARSHECGIVEIITGADEPATVGPDPDYIIRPGWHYTDSLVDVPGYDIRILPASGIVQSAIYWSVVGQIPGHLASSP